MKQCYEKKINTNICGVLEYNEADNSYYVQVELKDDIITVSFNDILQENLGRLISFKAEDDII